jgi:hypothetical protein
MYYTYNGKFTHTPPPPTEGEGIIKRLHLEGEKYEQREEKKGDIVTEKGQIVVISTNGTKGRQRA